MLMKYKDMQFHVKQCIKELCKRIKQPIDNIDFTNKRFPFKHQWSAIKLKSYREWLVQYLHNNFDARQELIAVTEGTNANTTDETLAALFSMDYGFEVVLTKADRKYYGKTL